MSQLRKRLIETQSLNRLEIDVEIKKGEVRQKYSSLKETIDQQEQAFLEELDQIYSNAKSAIDHRDKKLTCLGNCMDLVENNRLNTLNRVVCQTLIPINEEMHKLRDDCLLAPSLRLEWNKGALEKIEQLCTLNLSVAPYTERVYPKWLSVEKGESENEMEEPCSILSLDSNELLVSDRKKNVIQIYNEDGMYLSTVKDPNLIRPLYMCTYKTAFFVTCGVESGKVLKFEKNEKGEWQVVRIQRLSHPISGLNVDEQGFLYVFLTKERSVFALEASNLEIVGQLELKTDHFVEGRTRIMDAKLYESEWYVLFAHSEYSIQCFRKNGFLKRTVLGNDKLKGALHFCMDHEGNIIGSESCSDQVKVFSNEGEFITNIGSDGDFSTPRGITLDSRGRIIVSDLKVCDMLSCY